MTFPVKVFYIEGEVWKQFLIHCDAMPSKGDRIMTEAKTWATVDHVQHELLTRDDGKVVTIHTVICRMETREEELALAWMFGLPSQELDSESED